MPIILLPDQFDPYDNDLKRKINPKGDDLNYITISRKTPNLACGARRKGKLCKSLAGFGTTHVGYGRCKFHGGCNTGPNTAEGKAKAAQNSTVHGLYRAALTPREAAVFDQVAKQGVGLDEEIFLMKSKIIIYLKKHAEKWQKQFDDVANQGWEDGRAEEYADMKTRVAYSVATETEDGGYIEKATHYYNAGGIEDKPLIRALETLGRLVDKHAKLKSLDHTDAENILDGINKELRAASQGQVSISWGGAAQQQHKPGTAATPINEEKGLA